MHQLSDIELQGTLRRFCEEAIRSYAEGSGSSAPERVIQVHCALELNKLGFVVTIEPTGKQCRHWFGLREQSPADRPCDLRSVRRRQSGQGRRRERWSSSR